MEKWFQGKFLGDWSPAFVRWFGTSQKLADIWSGLLNGIMFITMICGVVLLLYGIFAWLATRNKELKQGENNPKQVLIHRLSIALICIFIPVIVAMIFGIASATMIVQE